MNPRGTIQCYELVDWKASGKVSSIHESWASCMRSING